MGQLLFVAFIVLFYYSSIFSGNLAAWNTKPLITGYVAGDSTGNGQFALHVLAAAATLLFPVARALGVHEVHYAMVVVLAMGIGLFAPPFGVGYYAACAISRVSPSKGMKPILGYILSLIVGTAIVAAVPGLSTGFGT